jgi:hypothetical protein
MWTTWFRVLRNKIYELVRSKGYLGRSIKKDLGVWV